MRLQHESSCAGHKTIFCTFTFMDRYLPRDESLNVREMQLFIKRLRKAGLKFKYFLCGEYCPTRTRRPHYHVIFIGLGMESAPILFKIWGKSDADHFDCQPVVTRRQFNYVAGYTSKKIKDTYEDLYQRSLGRVPPFQLSSLGMGKSYALSHVNSRGYIRDGGRDVIPPRYYRKILGLDETLYRDDIAEYMQRIFDFLEFGGKVNSYQTDRIALDYRYINALKPYRAESARRLDEIDAGWRNLEAVCQY